MKKFLLISCAFLICATTTVKAAPDEGMWLPIFVKDLNINKMNEMGLKLTAEDIYSINNTSMKDAIVNFGNFCTAEVVSDKGLLFTNHHCGYSAIQQHSSIDHDYLTDGFWANSFKEELPCEGLTATFFLRMEDVSAKVLADVNPNMTEKERSDAIRKVTKEIEKEASEDGKYLAKVNGLFAGNEYYLFIYQEYKDVRMVGAPPSSIGKFGGDTDNWMWPRHTGDFSVFRIYADKDNQPAEYSEDNVPYTPKYVLPISIKGVEKDDFTMIWGYPGSTDRYLPSWGVKLNLEQTNPSIDAIFEIILSNMKKGMDRSQDVNIMYASTHAGYANLWKNKKGETRGLKRLNVYDKKLKIESELNAWINADPARKEKYGEVLDLLRDGYKGLSDSEHYKNAWVIQGAIIGSKIMESAYGLSSVLDGAYAEKKKKEEVTAIMNSAKESLSETYGEYDQWTEELIFREIVRYLHSFFTGDKALASLKPIDEKYKGNVDAFVDAALKTSIFASENNLTSFLNKPNGKTLANDPISAISKELIGVMMSGRMLTTDASTKLNKGNRLFIAALREMNPEIAYYPNANFTMRLTYGSVLDYYPADAVHYDYICTLDGAMEKEDPTNEEFIIPAKLKALYNAGNYGDYADKSGKMVVCFLSDNDITGGNSGSPVINGNGEIIGIAFDGNWEAMSGDIAFEPELQRTISVDIRYVLFVIDKYAGCKRIIDELTIVK